MIKLSISIMHCSWNESRVEMLKDIESKINKSLLNGFSISDDLDVIGLWGNNKLAWKQTPADSTHHIVLQDDMIPCDNFVETLLKLIETKPDEIIHIFGTNRVCEYFHSQDINWFSSYDGTWGGAVLLPKRHFKWFEYIDSRVPHDNLLYDDSRMNCYSMYTKTKIHNITPTLLHHAGNNSSLIGNEYHKFRDANCLLSGNPLDIDWKNNKGEDNAGLIYNNSLTFCYMNSNDEGREEFLKIYGATSIQDLVALQAQLCYGNQFKFKWRV